MGKGYQICDGYIHRKIADADVLICIGDRVADFNGYITLNDTCAFLWDLLQTPQTQETLIKALCGEYEVTEAQAQTDISQWLQTLVDRGMIREVSL